ncbi:hypothetical protein GPJ56_009657 [Histomonas meleagridis]|uniref:uncharacterized protein n=1 Tax=Histomonas meleagridis TaxID=135588 RepID=UPI003559666C|nr:hypothetical protein GPJ56_009657 [Histomonas meleagridis]KAH0804396.1 hypothetical protein GO595_003226 [Histomonas meleagridis]
MKKFLDKTKKSLTVGIGKIDEKVSDKKHEESPEFTKAMDHLHIFEESMKGFQKSVSSLREAVMSFGGVLITAGDSYAAAIKDGEDGRQNAVGAQKVSNEIKVYYNNANNYYIPNFITSKLNDTMNQIKAIKQLIEKRKKNQILLNKEQSDLKAAREKNQNVEKHEESTKARKKKFKKYNKQVLEEVDKLYSARASIYQELYSALVFYQSELMSLTLKEINQNVPQFSLESNKSKYQSVTVKPPEGTVPK